MQLLTGSIGAVLIILAVVHVWWALAGAPGGVAIPTREDGRPAIRPSAPAAVAVALALLTAAYLVLARGGLVFALMPDAWIGVGTWAVAVAFAARTIGEFRYVGLFRRVRGTRFALWDAWLFTPLCALLAVGAGLVAAA